MNTDPQSPDSNGEHRPDASPQDHLHTLQDDAQAALASAKEHGSAQFEQYRDTAAQQIETLAQSAQSAAEQMQDSDTFGLSHYVTDVAQHMTTLAGNLRGKSVDELLHQAGKLARDNPALFLTGSVALGFGLSRFLRASTSAETPTAAPSSDAMGTQDKVSSNPELSPMVAADQEFPVSHPNMGDVYHSGKPSRPDGAVTPGVSTPHPVDSSTVADDSSDADMPRNGLSRGEV